jgi:hypothetical protein
VVDEGKHLADEAKRDKIVKKRAFSPKNAIFSLQPRAERRFNARESQDCT